MTTKMVVIPYDKYLKLLRDNDRNDEKIHKNHKGIIDNSLAENKEKENDILPQSVMKERLESNENNEDPIGAHPNTENKKYSQPIDMLNEEDILDYFPKNYKNKCRLLLSHMQKNCIEWDAK